MNGLAKLMKAIWGEKILEALQATWKSLEILR